MVPLSDRIRPKRLQEFIGQKHILAEDKLLYQAIKSGKLFSMILWGPPGVGKTTLARLIANEIDAEFMEFSAVQTGIAELKKIFEKIRESKTFFSKNEVIIFIDEIHRFNKAQQDALLPWVENGTIILIGATTENPSFEIISPLLSRTRVFILKQHDQSELAEVIQRALTDKENGYGNFKIKLDSEAQDFLIESANGDARIILNTLEVAIESVSIAPGRRIKLTRALIEEAMQKRALGYDKGGEEHYNTISAFIKSMRASQPDAAIYYLARMIEAGEDPLFIARRMVIFASEDIGLSQPAALVVANEVFRAVETIGLPEAAINLAQGVAYLSLAKKDRTSYDALQLARNDVHQFGNLPIPMNIRNAPTKLMKETGYGQGYEKYSNKDLLPDKLKGKKYYKK